MSAEDLLKELLNLKEKGVVLDNLKLVFGTSNKEISKTDIVFIYPNWCFKIF